MRNGESHFAKTDKAMNRDLYDMIEYVRELTN